MSWFLVPDDANLPLVGPFGSEAEAVEADQLQPYLRVHGGQIREAQSPDEHREDAADEDGDQ